MACYNRTTWVFCRGQGQYKSYRALLLGVGWSTILASLARLLLLLWCQVLAFASFGGSAAGTICWFWPSFVDFWVVSRDRHFLEGTAL